MLLARLEHGGLERPEVACEIELAVVVEVLVGKHQDGIFCKGRADIGKVGRGQRPAEHHVADLGTECGRDRLDGNGH